MPDPLDCLIVAGDLPREFLGDAERQRMRLVVDGVSASLAWLAHYFHGGRDPAAAGRAVDAARRRFVSLNGPWLAQFLQDHGLSAAWIGAISAQTEAFAALLARRPAVVAISTTFLPMAQHIDALAVRIKARSPSSLVVAGGMQVWKSRQHLRLLQDGAIAPDIAPAVAEHNYLMEAGRASPLDALVVAERGESVLVELIRRVRAGRAWQDLGNLAWQEQGAWRLGPEQPEQLPPVSIDWRRQELPCGPLWLPIQAGEGCGCRCAFCDFRGLKPRVVPRDLRAVVSEIATMPSAADGIRRVYFTDDNLLTSAARARAVTKSLISSGLPVRWRGLARVDAIEAPIAEALAESGCLELNLGIESGDPDVLAAMGKRLTPEQVLTAIGHLGRCGISTKSFFIIGFPGETTASVDRTIDLLNAYPTDGPAVHRYQGFVFAPLPLAEIARPANRIRHGLQGYGFHWRHATMDAAEAHRQLERMFSAIKPDLSPSYPLEVPELPGLAAPALKDIFRLRNRLALARHGGDPTTEPALWDRLQQAFAGVDASGISAG